MFEEGGGKIKCRRNAVHIESPWGVCQEGVPRKKRGKKTFSPSSGRKRKKGKRAVARRREVSPS